jgi:hypothetical protein
MPLKIRQISLPRSIAAGTVALASLAAFLPAAASAQVVAAPPYKVSMFAAIPKNTSQADSIVTWHDRVIVGFENHVAKDGTDGKSSTIVEFDLRGNVTRSFSVKGHNDGLRVVGDDSLWALQN